MERTCVDCAADIRDRPPTAYLCKLCFFARQRAARQRYYESKPRGMARYTRTVGTEVVCPCGQERFIKTSGNHRFGPLCRAANDSFHDAVYNSRHPNRPFGPKVRALMAVA
jgi:hypothetical protein